MKKLKPESEQKIKAKLNRLKHHPKYLIAAYIDGDVGDIEDLVTDFLYETPYEIQHRGSSFEIALQNGSKFIAVSTDDIISDLTTHIAFLDREVTEKLIAEKIRPHITEYIVESEDYCMANPNPIIISFSEEGEENAEEKE